MSKRAAFVLLSAALLASAGSPHGWQSGQPQTSQKTREDPQQRPTFRTEANFVRVDVYPTRNGSPVRDLIASDFTVFEDGRPQQIDTFEFVEVRSAIPQEQRVEPNTVQQSRDAIRDPRARVFVLFLDAGHVTVGGSWNIREPLIRMIDRLLGPEDLVGIMTPTMSAGDIVFGRKTQVIAEGLRDRWPWGERFTLARDERERMWETCFTWNEHRPILEAMRARKRERDTLNALQELVRFLRYEREERKAIVTISEGWVLYRPDDRLTRPVVDARGQTEPIPGPDPVRVDPGGRLRRGVGSTQGHVERSECDADRLALSLVDHDRVFRDIIDDANRANASFYTVDPRGLAVFDSQLGPEQPPTILADARNLRGRLDSLQVLAENTDGLSVVNTGDLDKGLRRISDDLSSYYLLGYYTSNAKLDGRFRKIEVKVNRPDVDVRARRGYRAATPEEVAKTTTASAAPVPESVRVARAAVDGLARLRSDAPFHTRAIARKGKPSTVWVAGALAKGAARAATAEITIVNGSETVTANAVVSPGQRGFVTAVVLQQVPSAPIEVRVQIAGAVPEGAVNDGVRIDAVEGLSQPLLFRRGPATGNRVEVVAEPAFSRTERLRLELPLEPQMALTSGRILDRNSVALTIPVSITDRTDTASNQRWGVAEITLAPLGAGDYVVELAGTVRGAEQRVLTAIRVTR